MQAQAATKLMTAEQFAELPQTTSAVTYELIRGELVEMTKPGGRHGFIAFDIGYFIGRYVREHRLGKVTAAETGFVLERDPDTVRAADVAFIATDRLPQAQILQAIPIAPDLAVEVLSPNDRAAEVSAKIDWWLRHGTRLVWVADPDNRTITRYQPDGAARVFRVGDTLDGGEVLPGFELKLGDLYGG